jgi:hypothetical protein
MPRISGIDRKKAYGKAKKIVQKFEVSAIGNLAGSRTASLVEKLSWLLHHPELPPMFEKEWAAFSKKAKAAIEKGDSRFFLECAMMVALITTRMSRIDRDERIELSEISKKQPSARRLVHWMMGKDTVDPLGRALLSTLLHLAFYSDANAKFSHPQVMQALTRLYPTLAGSDEKNIREVLKKMGVGGFPIHASKFKELFLPRSKPRREKSDALK